MARKLGTLPPSLFTPDSSDIIRFPIWGWNCDNSALFFFGALI